MLRVSPSEKAISEAIRCAGRDGCGMSREMLSPMCDWYYKCAPALVKHNAQTGRTECTSGVHRCNYEQARFKAKEEPCHLLMK